jgi:APA family basic amino acid/polyamine antiporter
LKLVRGAPGFAAAALAGLLYSLWAFYGAGIEASLWSLAMTATGAPLYLLMRWANRRAAPPPAPRG